MVNFISDEEFQRAVAEAIAEKFEEVLTLLSDETLNKITQVVAEETSRRTQSE